MSSCPDQPGHRVAGPFQRGAQAGLIDGGLVLADFPFTGQAGDGDFDADDGAEQAIHIANDSRFGLQAGVFTRDLGLALEAGNRLEFGGVLVNEVPTFRTDQMPYGGIKESGNTREGPAYAVRELTEERLVTLQA